MDQTTTHQVIELLLARLRQGDLAARDELINLTYERLLKLTRKMLRGFPIVRGWEQTDDVFQNAALRLRRAMEQVQPASVEDFLGLGALQIRRELLDLARHYTSRQKHESGSLQMVDGEGEQVDIQPVDETFDPVTLALWTEFHRCVEALPPQDRRIVDLLWYQELTQSEAAEVLKVDKSTVKRHWRDIKLALAESLEGIAPDAWRTLAVPE